MPNLTTLQLSNNVGLKGPLISATANPVTTATCGLSTVRPCKDQSVLPEPPSQSGPAMHSRVPRCPSTHTRTPRLLPHLPELLEASCLLVLPQLQGPSSTCKTCGFWLHCNPHVPSVSRVTATCRCLQGVCMCKFVPPIKQPCTRSGPAWLVSSCKACPAASRSAPAWVLRDKVLRAKTTPTQQCPWDTQMLRPGSGPSCQRCPLAITVQAWPRLHDLSQSPDSGKLAQAAC